MSDIPDSTDVTSLLIQWSRGDRQALQRLMPLVFEACWLLAASQLARAPRDHTLAPASLVHELYSRLVDQRRATWEHRAHFYGISARIVRRVLVDYARARRANLRGGSASSLSRAAAAGSPDASHVIDLLAIDEALQRLAAVDSDQVRIVELRLFAGLTVKEAAHVVARSPATVDRKWQRAKAWLHRELYPRIP